MFTVGKCVVLGPFASADAPNHWVGVASLGAGQCQKFAGNPHLSTESSEEPIFETREDEIDGAFVATCPGHSIVTQADSVEKLREMIKDAVHCHFGDAAAGEMPRLIRLHFVRNEVLIA